jgi:hypothetical protein
VIIRDLRSLQGYTITESPGSGSCRRPGPDCEPPTGGPARASAGPRKNHYAVSRARFDSPVPSRLAGTMLTVTGGAGHSEQ